MRVLVATVEEVVSEGYSLGLPRVPEKSALLWRVGKAGIHGVFLDHTRLLHALHPRLMFQVLLQACLSQRPPVQARSMVPTSGLPSGLFPHTAYMSIMPPSYWLHTSKA